LREEPSISPTYPARIFCLARTEEWHTAAVTLETANALGLLTKRRTTFSRASSIPSSRRNCRPSGRRSRPTPLIFRLYEAIGEPLPTTNLPLAFAHADLNANAGWKAQVEAAERLARVGAIAQPTSGALHRTAPSASGGVWERAAAVQTLDRALDGGRRRRDRGGSH
jgi:hypothetical protein